jgi:diguanylate cyclase (GGDEF)-like protein
MPASLTPPDATPARLLLVDDDPLLREMATRTLRHAGFDVDEAASGEAALQRFEGRRHALVLLDVVMEGIDGFETCRALRARPDGAHLPIVMLTGLDDSASLEQAFGAGATDFITKPISWALLAHRVRHVLRAGRMQEEAARHRASLARTQAMARLGGWEMSADGRTLRGSAELAGLYGKAAPTPGSEHPMTAEQMLGFVVSADRPRVAEARRAARGGRGYQLVFEIALADGSRRTLFEQAEPRLAADGSVLAVEGVAQDITDRIEAERRIRHLARHDQLTTLPNRAFFLQLAETALARAERSGRSCAVLQIDLDRFKAVNDALGRSAGDEVLRVVAGRIQQGTRRGDLAGDQRAPGETSDTGEGAELVARVGGNAFTLLLAGVADERDAAAVAARLSERIATPIVVHGVPAAREIELTCSIGIALYPRDGTGIETLTRHAEQALYTAKTAGRGQFRFFDEGIRATAQHRLELEQDLRRAISGGQLRLALQPKIDAPLRRMVSAEALVRWQHPERGLIVPGEFIPLAEEVGLIVPLGRWVLRETCRLLAGWRSAGLAAVPVAVNMSAAGLLDEQLPGLVDALLAEFGLDPQLLMIEVTESVLVSDFERTVARLAALRAKGLRLALDDFGTGYSSLSYLRRFPIDEIKIDRSFLREAVADRKAGALVSTIITLGRLLDLDVVAEGVETAQESSFLTQQGCAYQQGYYFARPMPPEAFAALLQPAAHAVAAGAEVGAAVP